MDFYDELINAPRKRKKNNEAPKILQNLYKVPKRDPRNLQPTFMVPKPNKIQQADLLHLPHDNGYKYALVVADDHSKLCDATPLKDKTAQAVVDGFKRIYSHGILKKPVLMEVDDGGEFKSVVVPFFHDQGIEIRVAQPGRHRMQGIVERRNQLIGTALLKRQAAEELKTGQPATGWINDLPFLIKALNKKAINNLKARKKYLRKHPLPNKPLIGKDNVIIPIGTKVRVQLEYPIDVATGQKLHGRFRSGDIRWNPKERIIKEVLLRPNQPVQYLLDGDVGKRHVEPVAYTKNQLQIIPKDEQYPRNDVVQNDVQEYAVDKIVDRVKDGRVIWLKVKWRGYPLSEATWERRSTLIEDIPEKVREFEESLVI